MTHLNAVSRRRVCFALAAMPLMSACATGARPTRSKGTSRQSPNVALLLPLSGPQTDLGKRMAKAVWLAEDTSGVPKRTIIVDAGQTEASAATATQKAIDQGADVLVGPLFRHQAASVVQSSGGRPVLSLSNDRALSQSGAWVFGVTPKQSVDTVLGFAKQTGARRIAMMSTPGPLGERARAALQTASGRTGFQILPDIPATTKPTDMSAALQQSGTNQMPDILYVPTAASGTIDQAVASVSTGVTTIGSLQWSGLASDTLKRLDKACFTGPDPDRFNRLSAAYRAQLDEDMGVIAALAIDAVAMANTSGSASGFASRTTMNGLLGATRFDKNRQCSRSLTILRIDRGSVHRVT